MTMKGQTARNRDSATNPESNQTTRTHTNTKKNSSHKITANAADAFNVEMKQ